jgi:hypothetical protein
MANADVQASGEWDWLEESPLRIGCALIFARDVAQDKVFGAFDVDPTSAHMEDWEFDPEDRRIRVGRLGTWTFAIDESMESLHLAIRGRNVGARWARWPPSRWRPTAESRDRVLFGRVEDEVPA